MKSEIYKNGSDADLDLERNMLAAAEWSAGVRLSGGLDDEAAKPGWADVLAFGTPARPDLAYTRAKFASRVLALGNEGRVPLDGLVPSSHWDARSLRVEGRTVIEAKFTDGEAADDSVKDFYSACWLGYGLYWIWRSCAALAKDPTSTYPEDGAKSFAMSDHVRSVLMAASSFMEGCAESESVPACVAHRAPDRMDSRFMGMFGVIRRAHSQISKLYANA